jgi:hypothetical protein
MQSTVSTRQLLTLAALLSAALTVQAQTPPAQTSNGPAAPAIVLGEADTQRLINVVKMSEQERKSPENTAFIRMIKGEFGRPGSSFGVTSGFGLASGQSFVSVAGVYDADGRGRTNGNGRVDGSATAGVGLGNPIDSVGLEMTMSLTSLNPRDGTLGDSGDVGVKLHKMFPSMNNLGLAVGTSNAGRWGDAKLSKRTSYAVASMDMPVSLVNGYPLQASLGVGNGAYRSAKSISLNTNKANGFASLGTQINMRTAANVSWSGNELNLGMGWMPFNAPFTLNVGITDVTNRTVEGKGYNFSLGYAFGY